jgi:hypothetical protein
MPESLPWASGNRKAPPGGKPRRKRRFRLKSKKQGLLAALYAVITLTALTAALITQITLLVVVTVLSGVVTVLAAATAIGEPDPVPARTAPTPRSANPRGSADPKRSPRQSGTVVICTKTKVPIDDCNCPVKHVRSAAGARRYKLQIGDPIVKQRAPKKPKGSQPKVPAQRKPPEPKVSTTKNARPIRPPVGEIMGRVS